MWNKIVKFFKKYDALLVILIGMLLIIYLFKKLIVAVIQNINVTTCFLLFPQITNGLIKYSNITQCTWINAIICYLELCGIFLGIRILGTLVMAIVIEGVDIFLKLLKILFFGRKHDQSLQYNIFQVGFLKVNADINIVIFWIKNNICGLGKFESTNFSIVKKAKFFTLESIVDFGKNFFDFFFKRSIIHLLFGIYVIYINYLNQVQVFFTRTYGLLKTNTFSFSTATSFFELIFIIVMLGYIFVDARHKAIGYLEIRKERFKKLLQVEEKLLVVMKKISFALETNIEIIVAEKKNILQDGAEKLTGKKCYICDGNISYLDEKDRDNRNFKDSCSRLENLVEMKKEFNKLKEINKEFKKSSLSYSNIFLIDHATMINKLTRFYFPGQENFEYNKTQLFCKSSREKWFEKHFIEPITVGDKKIYYTERKANQVIKDVSKSLDDELVEAFELEMYLKRYEKKMLKRFKKIYNFSRFNFK